MQTLRPSLVAALVVTLALSATATAKPPATVAAPPLPLATPESQGMSSERLGRLHAEIAEVGGGGTGTRGAGFAGSDFSSGASRSLCAL